MNSEHHCDPNLPRSLVQINLQNPSTVSWENMRGGGLPDHSSNEWNLIVSFFEKGHGERFDQTELVKFFCGNAEKSSTFRARLHGDLKRRSKGGKIPEVARINKQRKTIDNVSVRATPMISESLGGAAAAEGSPPLPDGASARPRPPPTRRRGRPPDDPARQSAVAEPRRKALQPPVRHLPAPPRPRPPEACRPSPWLHGAVIPLVPACRLRKPPSSIATPRRVVALCRSHGAVRNGVVNQLAKNICRLTQP
jgi:hypothetical protein